MSGSRSRVKVLIILILITISELLNYKIICEFTHSLEKFG